MISIMMYEVTLSIMKKLITFLLHFYMPSENIISQQEPLVISYLL